MEYLKVWTNFLEITEPLEDAEMGRLFRMMLKYAASGEEPRKTISNERFLWPVAKQQIDMAASKNESLRQNALKGGRPKTKENQTEPEETNENQTKPNETNENQTKPYKDKDKEKENNKDNIKGVRRFTPPTTDEVRAYCQERGNSVDAERFVDFYTSKGWKIGKEPMKDWRAAVRTWEKEDNGRKPAKVVSAQQYAQRDYSEVGTRIMDDLDREMAQYLAKERGAG